MKLVTNLNFYSALLGFIGLLISTSYGWYLGHKVKAVRESESKKVADALPIKKQEIKLEATQIINKTKKEKNEYVSKVSNRVFFILIISFGVSIGGIIMGIEENSSLEKRVKIIEDYLWEPVPGGGGIGASDTPTISEQISSITESILKIEGLQLKIIDTIDETEDKSKVLAVEIKQLKDDVLNLKKQIEILKRQQGGAQSEGSYERTR